MNLRVITKSSPNGSGEELYLCTDEEMFKTPPEEFFFMHDGDTIDTDKILDGLGYLDLLVDLPLPFDRPLKAV